MAEYIDRKAVGLTDFEIFMCNGNYKEAFKMLLDKIDSIPAADVAPVRHGRWILYKETVETTVFAGGHIYAKGDVVPYGYVCSECGRWEGNKEPFCNCGAKMEVET